jgi:translocation and assembly module TamB
MSRGRKIAVIIGSSIAGLLLVLLVAGILIVRSAWFANFVRLKIITAVEEATGGRVEIRSFHFAWTHLRADVRDFVVHGLEPSGAAPLLRVRHLQVDLKLLSPFKGFVDIAYLLVDTPQANVIVFPDGRTNIPAPKIKKPSERSPVETIVNLAIGRFDLVNGSAAFLDQPTRFHATGQNLRAHLTYNTLNPSYAGEIDVMPLILRSGNNPPVNVNVKLPISMEKDKITFANAELTTPQSKIVLSGEMDHFNLPTPHSSAHVNAQVALDEVRRAAGLTIPLDLSHGPRFLTADLTAAIDQQRVQIQSARVTLGGSNLEAKGTLKDPRRPGNLQFNATLALNELGRLLKVSARPEGILRAGGNATLRQDNSYTVTANVDGRGLGFHEGATHLTGINLDSALTADPRRIELTGLRLSALGGSFNGAAGIEEMRRYHVAGDLHNFDIARVAGAFIANPPGYDGIVSGPLQAQGDLNNTAALTARAALAIAPGTRGVPVSGRLNVDYNGRADTVMLGRSYLQLPHTRVDLSGALGKQIDVRLVSRNLSDFRPLGNIPVTLNNGGAATLNAAVTGSLSNPRISAHAALNNFAADGRSFTSFAADVNANRGGVTLSNAALTRGALQANFSASVGLRNWKPENSEPLRVDATIRNADLADVLALAGQSDVPATGALTADAHIAGTVGSPTGNADLSVVKGTIEEEPFDTLTAHVAMTPQTIDIPTLSLVAGASRIDATANYQHAVNDLERGTLRAHVASNQVQLAQFQSLVKDRPGLQGVLSLNGDATANVLPAANGTDVEIASVNANFSVRGMQMEGKALGDLTATAASAGNTLQYNVNSNFAGSTLRVTGRSLLTGNHDTTATASIANLPLDRTLALAGRRDLPVSGTISADAQLSGTLQDPRVNATLSVVKGSAWQEPFDRLQATVAYTDRSIDLSNLRLDDGPAYLTASGSFTHPPGDLENGQVRFQAQSNQFQLGRFHVVQQSRPGLAGTVQLNADGAATLRKGASPLFAHLNANLNARGLSLDKKPLGDLTATATTRGQEVVFNLTSNLAQSDIRGSGRLQLAADYPLNAQVTFNNVTYAGLGPLLGAAQQPFDASANGTLTVAGPLEKPDQIRGEVTVAKLEAHSTVATTGRKPRVTFELHNAAPVDIAIDHSLVTVRSAHITGPFTDVNITGTAALTNSKAVNLRADGNIKLEILEALDPDIFSAGNVVLNASVTGTIDQPAVNGRLTLQGASINMVDVPNGLSNATGTVVFNATQATIQNITGETGGGKLTLAGNVSYGGPEVQVRLTAAADKVRLEYPESVSTLADARLNLNGTTTRSLLTGTVTIEDVALHSHSDFGSILTQAAAPPSTATASTGFLAGVRFDVKIQTAPDIQFRTSLTQNLSLDANLTLRGTPDHPGMLGRIVVTRGQVIFFGTKYDIDQGTVSFYNPNRIDPILNIALTTTVQGIDVSISVTGPADRMKLAYHSDPPMQFSDLVALLASGKATTTDPVLAARAPVAQQPTLEQTGMSTLLGQAVANPVSGRLQRLFGVSQLKIDPQIIGSSNTALATMTLQQQITREVTFTYIQDVTQSNPQVVRMEWAINPQWSAVAQRDINGFFDLDFFWKKRFR